MERRYKFTGMDELKEFAVEMRRPGRDVYAQDSYYKQLLIVRYTD